jgi:hypothetical protein
VIAGQRVAAINDCRVYVDAATTAQLRTRTRTHPSGEPRQESTAAQNVHRDTGRRCPAENSAPSRRDLLAEARPRSAVISSPFPERGGDLRVCVVDMSSTHSKSVAVQLKGVQ